jgi:hypothetical protein
MSPLQSGRATPPVPSTPGTPGRTSRLSEYSRMADLTATAVEEQTTAVQAAPAVRVQYVDQFTEMYDFPSKVSNHTFTAANVATGGQARDVLESRADVDGIARRGGRRRG